MMESKEKKTLCRYVIQSINGHTKTHTGLTEEKNETHTTTHSITNHCNKLRINGYIGSRGTRKNVTVSNRINPLIEIEREIKKWAHYFPMGDDKSTTSRYDCRLSSGNCTLPVLLGPSLLMYTTRQCAVALAAAFLRAHRPFYVYPHLTSSKDCWAFLTSIFVLVSNNTKAN